MIRLVLADDHQLFLDGLQSLLSSSPEIEILGSALNGQQAIDLVSKLHPDLILLDVNMPEMDGIETTTYIKAHFPEVKVLILTMFNTPDFIGNLVACGADGYILKNTGQEELLNSINKVKNGEPYFGAAVTSTIMSSFRKSNAAEPEAHLTKREVDVLNLITQECTTQEIADKLFISNHTVETHRKNLLSKLNVRNTAGLVKYAIGKNLA